MIYLAAFALIACLVLFAAALLLWLRLRNAADDVRGSDPRLVESLLDHVYESLLPASDDRGPLALEVRSREPQDDYRTVGELLERVREIAGRPGLAERENLVKAIYQLQDSLDLEPAAVSEILEPVIRELRHSAVLDKPVGAVDLIEPGERLDRATMWPLSSGTRVRQPLGVVIRDRDGKVISRAKVFCC